MKITTLLILMLLLVPAMACAEESQPEPSVLVKAQSVKQGSLPNTITAYGTVAPLADGSTNLSQLKAGQVLKLYVSAGQKVKQGESLLDFSTDPAAVVSYNQAVSTLATAKAELVRTRQLLSQQLATKSQVAQAEKAVSDAELALTSEKTKGSDKAFETLTAPLDGVVTSVSVSNGDRVQANAPLLQIAHSAGMAVIIGVPLDDRKNIQVGNIVHLEALDTEKATIDGTVAFVADIIDPKTRLVTVSITVPSTAATALFPGEQFQAAIEIGKLAGILVPRSAVIKDNKGPYIYQMNGDKADRVDVKIIGESGDIYVITGTIDEQKKVITVGNYELKYGDSVREQTEASAADATP